jgi:RNA polymerase sigma-70 factor (subfamily 1)
MSVRCLALLATALLAPLGVAQVQVDDPPKLLETGARTKEELNRQKADKLLREARTLFALGVIRQRHEQLIQAVSILEKALAADPDSLEVRRFLAPIYVAVGREDAAMTLCKQVLDRDPYDAETAFHYARLLRADGRPAEAIATLEKAVAGNDAQARPERLLFMLSDLSDLLEKKGDFAGVAKAQETMVRTMIDKKDHLLYGHGYTREDVQGNLGRAYERLGRARVQTKEYDKAVAAFKATRDTLLSSDDPEARHQAIRMNWNLSEIAASQGRWSVALEALDAYLDHSPTELEPYQKKLELLRKLGREVDIIPALRKYAARDEFHLGLQLLLAGEMAKQPRFRGEAEKLYTALLEKNIKPEIYRGLFHLYRLDDRMQKVLDSLDSALQVARAKEGEAKPEERESAEARARAMFQVLRSDPPIVAALLPEALAELTRNRERAFDTWSMLAVLAARARKLEEAELFFRQCLAATKATPQQEVQVYAGLLDVLLYRKKYDEVVKLCRDVLAGRRRLQPGLNGPLHGFQATALANLGQFDEAIAEADKAVTLSNDSAKVACIRRKADILARAGRYADAVKACEETMREFPQMRHVHEMRYSLSNVYSFQGDHAKSEEQLRLVLETDPDAPLANNNLGYQMADRNVNLDEAERMIRRAIEVERTVRREAEDDGENAAYLDSLGWVLFRQGKLSEAREWLEKTVALPDGAEDPTVWDHLGDVYARLDMTTKAREAWQTSIKLYDASDIVQDVLIEANQRLTEYLKNPAMPFHLWLRHLAQDRIIDTHRRHRQAQRRSIDREQAIQRPAWSDQSSVQLVAQLVDGEHTPASAAIDQELQRRLTDALAQLDEDDREIILMRHHEQLSNQDVAAGLGLTEAAASMRYLRAVRKLRSVLVPDGGEPAA